MHLMTSYETFIALVYNLDLIMLELRMEDFPDASRHKVASCGNTVRPHARSAVRTWSRLSNANRESDNECMLIFFIYLNHPHTAQGPSANERSDKDSRHSRTMSARKSMTVDWEETTMLPPLLKCVCRRTEFLHDEQCGGS